MASDAPSEPSARAPTGRSAGARRSTIWRALGAGVLGDTAGVELTGLTLATADLRPGDVFVAVQGVNRHGAEFAAGAAEKGAVAIVTDAAGAEVAPTAGLPVVIVEDPRGLLGEISAWVYGTGRDDDLPILFAPTGTNGKTSVSHLLEGILEPARRRHRPVVHGRAPHRRAGDRVAPDDARGVRDARAPRAHARARRRGRRGRGQRPGAQPSARRRHRVRRRRVHQPHPRPPRRLRRHARVLRGEASAVPRRSLAPRGDLRSTQRRAPKCSPGARCPLSPSARRRSPKSARRQHPPTGSSRSSTSVRTAQSSG